MNKRNILGIIFLFFILIGLGYFASSKTLDPDFGWHLRTGSLILERGVPKIDWYSYTMPNFPWIDHEWLTDIVIYKIHSLLGIQAVLLFFLILTSLAFVLLIKTRSLWYFFLPVLLGYWACLGFLGIRPQLLTILFIAILWKILREFLDSGSRLIYLCPVLFIIWVNLHGGFLAGLFLLALILILELFKKSNFSKKIISWHFLKQQNFQEHSWRQISILFALLILSFLATFINPYGLRIYEEVFRTIGDSFLRFHIAEWLPLFLGGSLPVLIISYISLFWGLFLVFRKKIDFTYSILLLVFFLFALSNQRHFFIFVILSIPIFAELIFYLWKAADPAALKSLFKGFKKCLIFCILLGILAVVWYSIPQNENCSLVYPEKALCFLKTLPLSENLLNEYAWGGYLIWQLPERKLFIDGRMPSWRQNTQFVFNDYVKIMDAEENFQELLEKYEIQIALLDKNKKTEAEKKRGLKTNNNLSRFLTEHKWLSKFFGLEPPRNNIYQELMNLGWKIIYEDETAIILKRQNND